MALADLSLVCVQWPKVTAVLFVLSYDPCIGLSDNPRVHNQFSLSKHDYSSCSIDLAFTKKQRSSHGPLIFLTIATSWVSLRIEDLQPCQLKFTKAVDFSIAVLEIAEVTRLHFTTTTSIYFHLKGKPLCIRPDLRSFSTCITTLK